MGTGNLIIVGGYILILIGSLLVWQGNKINISKQSKISENRITQEVRKQTEKMITIFRTTFTDLNNKELSNFTEVKVLSQKILSAQRGYMKIEVDKNYLNRNFDDPITLNYKSGKYQPVMLTFINDKKWGAGVVFTSPEYERKAAIYLNQCFRFGGGGKMIYTSNLIFELYYNDYCIYFVTQSGEIRFEHTLPPMSYGKNLCIGYFNEDDKERNKRASTEFPELERFFKD